MLDPDHMPSTTTDADFRASLASAPPTVVVASFRRSGTHLTIDSLLNNAAEVNPTYITLETLNPVHKEHVSGSNFIHRLAEAGQKSVIVKTHLGPTNKRRQSAWRDDAEALIARSRVVYIVRDPRDVMVSLQKFICSYTPVYREKSFSAHLDRHLPLWRDHVAYWHAREVPMVRFEDWAQSYEATLDRCLAILELRCNNGPIARLYQHKQRAAKWQRIPRLGRFLLGGGVPLSTTAKMPGSGSVGGWRETFTASDRQKVVDICGPWLETLGYGP